MNKNNQVNNQVDNQNHGDHCQHVQIGGQAYYDDRKYFLFSPDAPVPQAVESFRKAGVGQQMSDGTFDFVPQPRTKSRSVLIRKLAHGRISRTQDDAVQLTLKFSARRTWLSPRRSWTRRKPPSTPCSNIN